jgi:hypothetical protein
VGEIEMKKTLIVVALCLFSGTAFISQTPPPTAQSNGTIVENAPCPPNPTGTYDQYVANVKKQHDDESAVANSSAGQRQSLLARRLTRIS